MVDIIKKDYSKEISLDTFLSFRFYHKKIYDKFLDTLNYEFLNEFISLIKLVMLDLQSILKNDPKSFIIINTYILEMKTNAHNLWDLADSYFDEYEYDIICDYCDYILSLQ